MSLLCVPGVFGRPRELEWVQARDFQNAPCQGHLDRVTGAGLGAGQRATVHIASSCLGRMVGAGVGVGQGGLGEGHARALLMRCLGWMWDKAGAGVLWDTFYRGCFGGKVWDIGSCVHHSRDGLENI